MEAIASRLEAIASRVEAIAIRLEAIASRVEAIASRLEAIAIRVMILFRFTLSLLFESHRDPLRTAAHPERAADVSLRHRFQDLDKEDDDVLRFFRHIKGLDQRTYKQTK